MSKSFYAELKALPDYSEMVEEVHYSDLPADWVCILTDVKNSTKAIEGGRYKQVNMIGVSTIVAVQNALGDLQFPFVFGGDGATLAIPIEELERVKLSLSHTRKVSKEMFDLELRIAVIPATEILAQGAQLKVAKLRISETQTLALLRGEGWTLAEKWMKQPEERYGLSLEQAAEGEFTGLECRWNPLPARKDEVMALIVQARVGGDHARQVYRQILKEILGPELRPLSQAELNLKWPAKFLWQEAKIKIRGSFGRVLYALRTLALLAFQVTFLNVRGRKKNIEQPIEYMRELQENTDYLKFDECLRMILDVSAKDKERLLGVLEGHKAKGEIYYGFHCDPCALLTCYIQGPHRHIHFVDAAGGGYAMAAKQLKAEKLKA